MDLEDIFFQNEEFSISNEMIGKGSFGCVYKASKKDDEQEYAAKIINTDNFDGHDQMLILREALVLHSLNHPSIIKLCGINFQSNSDPKVFAPTIITKFFPNGSLKEYLTGTSSHKKWNFTKKYISLLGIADAMRYLHEHGIIHRDLKPGNILIDENYYPIVCDFDLFRCFQESFLQSPELTKTKEFGTPLYLAPEVIDDDNDKYGPKIDVYSFSMIAYEILTDKEPFFEQPSKRKTFFKLAKMIIRDGVRPKFTENVTEKMKNLLSRCWSVNIDERPSFNEIFERLSNDFSYINEEIDEEEVNRYIENLRKERKEAEKRERKNPVTIYMKKMNEENKTEKDEDEEEEEEEEDLDDSSKIIKDKNAISYKLFYKSKTAHVVESPKAKGDVIIPKSITFESNEYKITEICDKAFANSYIESLYFPPDSCVEAIGNSVLENSNVKKVFIPQSLIKLNDLWCKDAKLLNEIDVDPKNQFFFNNDGFLIYKKMSDLEILFAPSNVEGEYSVPEEVTRIGSYSFSRCQKITSLKSSSFQLKEVGSHSFCQCKNLKSVVFQQQESQVNFDSCCFSGTRSLETVELSCKSIQFGNSCFIGATNLNEVKIKGSEVNINNDCFKHCSSIRCLSIQADKVEIGDNQFSNLKLLEEIKIEVKSDANFGIGCFSGAEKLKSVTIIGKNVCISNSCFMNCHSLSKLIIPNSSNLTIGTSGFNRCYKLEFIEIGAKNTLKIGERCFCDSGVKTANLYGSKVEINKECFKNLQSIESVSIASNVIELESSVFDGCFYLQNVNLEAALSLKIGDFCFSGDLNINTLEIHGNSIYIGKSSFINCVSIKKINLIDSEQISFDDNSFENCTSLDTVEMSLNKCVKFGSFCFSKATNLSNVILNSEQIIFFNNCFDNCSSLSKIECKKATEIHYFKNSFNEMDIEKCLHHQPTIKMKVLESKEKIKDDKCNIF